MDNTYNMPVSLIASRHNVAPCGFVVCLGEVIIVALREFLEHVLEDDSLPKDSLKTLSSDLRSISDTKALFSEAIKSLDLYANYLQRPGEKTAKRLKDSLEHRKVPDNERHSPDKINDLVDIFRTYLNKKNFGNFGYECDDNDNNYDIKGTKLANKNLDYDLGVESQPRSISPDGNKFAHSTIHDNNENDLKNKNINENERNGEKECTTGIQNNKEYGELKFSSAELKQRPHEIKSTLAKNSKIREKDKYNKSHEHKIYKDSSMKDEAFSLAINGKHAEHVGKNMEFSGEKSLLLDERIMKEKAWISRDQLMESDEEKNLKEENIFLREKLKLLKNEHEELLMDYGEYDVREKAKEKKERKSELFHQTSLSIPEAKVSSWIHRKTRPSKEPGVITGDKSENPEESSSDDFSQMNPSFPCAIVSSGEVSQIDVKQLPGKDRKREAAPDDKYENVTHGDVSSGTGDDVSGFEKVTSAVQSSPKEKTSSGEELNQSGTGASVIASTGRDGNNDDSLIEQSYDTLPYSVQQDYSNAPEYITLKHIPSASVAASLYNNYMFLLLSLAQNLLSCDVVKLKVWAAQRFSIDNPQNATDVLFQLDQKGFIHASDLSQLRDFFESILRIDLVCVVDAFLLGDYSLFREISASKKLDVNRSHTQQNTVRYQNILSSVLNPSGSSFQSLPNAGSNSPRNGDKSLPTTTRSQSKNGSKLPVTHQAAALNSRNTSKPMFLARSPDVNETLKNGEQNLRASGAGPPARKTGTVVADSSFSSERRTGTSNSTTRTNLQTNKTRNAAIFSTNGSKLSKFQRPDSVLNVQSSRTSPNTVTYQDDNWLCTHYKRHSYVKFECCDKFWPCHRCHNNQSSCGRRKLKSRDTKMLKCVYCDKVQQFGHFCCECGAKFADYYCGLCKHLTGRDDHPYHCEKCGICRIHGDRSFHCDVCGVCLDVQLRGNHKCRAGSAHDECCICLEDAFTGCQILPCSHKVHKECATQMIRSGITRCPICRESFAHKLERRPADAGKRSDFGK